MSIGLHLLIQTLRRGILIMVMIISGFIQMHGISMQKMGKKPVPQLLHVVLGIQFDLYIENDSNALLISRYHLPSLRFLPGGEMFFILCRGEEVGYRCCGHGGRDKLI